MEDQTEQTEKETEDSQTAEQPKAQAEPTPSEAQEKPTDWQAKYEAMRSHSRKWEERAKANAEAAEQLEKLKAQSDADSKTISDLKSKLTGYEHAAEKRKWADEVSSKTGVPAELLDADSLEGMQAQAQKLEKYLKPKGLPGQGSTPAQEPAGSSAVEFTRRLFGNEN